MNVEIFDMTDWTHEDVMAVMQRVNRASLKIEALRVVSHSICRIAVDTQKDALRMEIWRADRTKIPGWGDFFGTQAESAISDMNVLRTAREIERGSY
jgi:hypothetical protein